MARHDPHISMRQLSSNWTIDNHPAASRMTVSRRLKEFNLQSHNAVSKPLLSPAHVKARLNWCKQRRNWGYEKWATVIFSDEANFELINRKTIRRVLRYSNEKYKSRFVQKKVQGGGGWFGWNIGVHVE